MEIFFDPELKAPRIFWPRGFVGRLVLKITETLDSLLTFETEVPGNFAQNLLLIKGIDLKVPRDETF